MADETRKNGVGRSGAGRDERVAWNKGRQVGQKPPLKQAEVVALRAWLLANASTRDRALFELALDSKLRGSDLVTLRCVDVVLPAGAIRQRAAIRQKKTSRTVRFELTARTRQVIAEWLSQRECADPEWLFPGGRSQSHLTTRQYARILDKWVVAIGLDPALYGTHSLRRTKVAHRYRETRNIRAIQLLLGHSSLEHTVRYLGFEIDDALDLSEKFDL